MLKENTMNKQLTKHEILAVEIFFTKDKDITPLIKSGMNENSAKDTIRCYAQLVKGEPFRRKIQQGVIRALLENLHKNNDKEKLLNVIKGLEKHFEIRLNEYKEKNVGARKIVNEYKNELVVIGNNCINYPDEIDEELTASLKEGAKKQVVVNAYERNLKARQICIHHYGTNCFICGFNFEKSYGEEASGFIHVHHIKPLSEIETEYVVDPIKDLRPVCPNCHAFIHMGSKSKDINEIKLKKA
jgi:5-methylcytosine-specific restriction protein A